MKGIIDVNAILKGIKVEEYLKTATEAEVRELASVAQYQQSAIGARIQQATFAPVGQYSAEENAAYIDRMTRLRNFVSMVATMARSVLSDSNHKKRVGNRRGNAASEKLKALKRAVSTVCDADTARKVMAEFSKYEHEIENRYFPADRKVKS